MRKIILIIIIYYSCSQKKQPVLFFEEKSQPSIRLEYAQEPLLLPVGLPEEVAWGPELFVDDSNRPCIRSHSAYFYHRERGPRLELCFDNLPTSEDYLKNAINELLQQPTNKIRSHGQLSYVGTPVYSYFATSHEIAKLIQQAKQFRLGSRKILGKLKKIANIEQYLWNTSFSAPYFSLILFADSRVVLVFTAGNLEITDSSYHHLVFDFSNCPTLQQNMEQYLQQVEQKNLDYRQQCLPQPVTINEIYLGGNQQYGKFIEISNPSTEPLCAKSLQWSAGELQAEAMIPAGFLFPDQVVVFHEAGSKLSGYPLDWQWSQVKKQGVIRLKNESSTETIRDFSNHSFHADGDDFSYKGKEFFICTKYQKVYNGEPFCGDPGVEIQKSQTTNVCQLQDFLLNELNAYGIHEVHRINYHEKFLELQYIGANPCQISNLYLKIADKPLPFTITASTIAPQTIVLVGRGELIAEKKQFYKRNLISMGYEDDIHLCNPFQCRTLYHGLPEDTILVKKDKQDRIYSVNLPTGHIVHHFTACQNLLPGLCQFNHMSPGIQQTIDNPYRQAYINEINWMGSYTESQSIAKDEFVEIHADTTNTYQLQVTSSRNQKTFIIPLQEDAYNLFGSQSLECYPQINIIKDSEFSLANTGATLQLFSNDGQRLFSRIEYQPTLNQGLNQHTPPLRKSYIYSGYQDIWLNSSSSNANKNCSSYSYASPGSSNQFTPFLQKRTDLEEHLYDYITANHQPATSLTIHQYSIFKPEKIQQILQPIETAGQYSRFKIHADPIFATGEQIYFSHANAEKEYILYNNGLVIAGVHANPIDGQQEWVLLCNRGNISQNILDLTIRDSSSEDQLIPISMRGKSLSDMLSQTENFVGDHSELAGHSCGYILDPDAQQTILQPFGMTPTAVFTVATTSTIGNGISMTEGLDIYRTIGESKIQIHSYGKPFSDYPFSVPLQKGEYSLLKEGFSGETSEDYEVLSP